PASRTRAGHGLLQAGGGSRVVASSARDVVLVPFPFSDLSQTKVRPAVYLADAIVSLMVPSFASKAST
ncbi:MAG: hypothetical protein ACXVBY_10535, partial [Isosphaeraceae bacterium]